MPNIFLKSKSGGIVDHSELYELDYTSSGHTGFASSDDLTTVSGNLSTHIADAEISSKKGIEPLAEGMSSVTIVFAPPFSNADYVVTLGLEHTEDEPPSVYAMIVTNKMEDGFKVLFSGEIDSGYYKLNWFAKAY